MVVVLPHYTHHNKTTPHHTLPTPTPCRYLTITTSTPHNTHTITSYYLHHYHTTPSPSSYTTTLSLQHQHHRHTPGVCRYYMSAFSIPHTTNTTTTIQSLPHHHKPLPHLYQHHYLHHHLRTTIINNTLPHRPYPGLCRYYMSAFSEEDRSQWLTVLEVYIYHSFIIIIIRIVFLSTIS